uniref:Uncharacterized protein n=1 Tax=viral metagenome TaxID=1070528 RepID=A0A6H2A1A7_9ZZZZ
MDIIKRVSQEVNAYAEKKGLSDNLWNEIADKIDHYDKNPNQQTYYQLLKVYSKFCLIKANK